jgi:hypothetical protein
VRIYDDGDPWLLTEDLARRHKVAPSTIRTWRDRGIGPRGTRFGRHVKYRLSDVIAWEKAAEAAQQRAGV